MGKIQIYDFNFNHIEEIKIYRYAIEKDLRKRKKIKQIKDKYYSYDEWKELYVKIKYQHLTLKSLCDLKKYITRKLENEIDKDNSTSGFIYPVLIFIITAVSSNVSESFDNPDLKIFVTILFIMYFAYYMIKYEMFDDIAIKNLYRDYIEVIEEMIELKKNII